MAFDAGAVIGKVKLDGSDFVRGSQDVNKHSASMTKSMFTAQLAYDLFRQAVSFAANALKNSVSAYTESEMVTKQLETVLKSTGGVAGVTKDAVLDLAAALQQTTNFEDDAIVAADNLLLTFTNIGKDIFPQVTETMLDMSQAFTQDLKSSAIQLGKALQDPILGVTALRKVGVSFSQAQVDVIKNLVNTGKAAEAQQMILKELNTQVGNSARAARDTFGGAVISLNNNIGDLQENIGMYITKAGRPFVENANNIVKSISAWIMSSAGMKVITDVLSTLGGYLVAAGAGIKIFVEEITKIGMTTFKSVSESLQNFSSTGEKLNPIFLGVAAVMQVLFIRMQAITSGIKIFAAIISATKDSVDLLSGDAQKRIDAAQAKALAANSEILQQLQAKRDLGQKVTDEDMANAAKQMKANNAVMQSIIDYYEAAPDRYFEAVSSSIGDLVSKAVNSGDDIKNIMSQMSEAFSTGSKFIVGSLKGIQSELGNTSTASLTLAERTKQWIDRWKKPEIDKDNTVVGKFKEWADAHGITMEKIKAQNEKTTMTLGEKWEAVSGLIFDALQNLYQNISGALAQSLENDQTLEDNDYKRKKAQIEASVTDEAEKKKQLEALEKDHAAKTAEIKKKQFESQKVASIISAIIATAVGVNNALAMAELFPFNFVLAGIIAAAGAVQIGTIASQPTPEFAAGTGMGTYQGLALVGERGPELVNFGQPAQIFPADQTSGMLGGGIRQENNFYGDINSEIDLDRASAQQARKLRTLLRAS
jgi:hypothetical protein